MPLQLHCNCATATEPLQLQHCNCATPNRSLQEVVEVVREENPEEEQEEDTEKVTAREKLTLVEQLNEQRFVGKKLKKSEKEARLKKFVDENRKDLTKVARKSSFAPHRLPANDTEHLVNIVATAKGLTQKTVGEQSVFQVKVFGTLRDLKAKGYPQNEMEEIMRKSNNHISTILTMQQKKITGFFTFSPQKPKPSNLEQPHNIEAEEAEILRESKPCCAEEDKPSSIKKVKPASNDEEVVVIEDEEHTQKDSGTSSMKKNYFLSLATSLGATCPLLNAEVSKTFQTVAKELTPLVPLFLDRSRLYKNISSYTMSNSKFAETVNKTTGLLTDIQDLCLKGEVLLEAVKETSGSQLNVSDKVNKMERLSSAVTVLKTRLLGKMMEIRKPIKQSNRSLNIRINYKDARSSTVTSKCPIIKGSNTSSTWEECLNSIDGPRTKYGVKLDLGEFEKIAAFVFSLHDNGEKTFTVEKILSELNRGPEEKRGMKKLIVAHLPVMEIKTPTTDFLMAIDQFLLFPDLVARYSLDCCEGLEKEQLPKTADVPVRKPGSGRPKGTFKITEEIITEVKSFITFCGTQVSILSDYSDPAN